MRLQAARQHDFALHLRDGSLLFRGGLFVLRLAHFDMVILLKNNIHHKLLHTQYACTVECSWYLVVESIFSGRRNPRS